VPPSEGEGVSSCCIGFPKRPRRALRSAPSIQTKRGQSKEPLDSVRKARNILFSQRYEPGATFRKSAGRRRAKMLGEAKNIDYWEKTVARPCQNEGGLAHVCGRPWPQKARENDGKYRFLSRWGNIKRRCESLKGSGDAASSGATRKAATLTA